MNILKIFVFGATTLLWPCLVTAQPATRHSGASDFNSITSGSEWKIVSPFSKRCSQNVSQKICLEFMDSYKWLVDEPVYGYQAKREGNLVIVSAHGITHLYEHILGTYSIRKSELPETQQGAWNDMPAYTGNCKQRPPGSVCIKFSDDYVWLVFESVFSWQDRVDGKDQVEIVVGAKFNYEHVLGTGKIRITAQ